MFKSIKEFFFGKPKTEEAQAQCPYKMETVKQPEPVPAPVIETVKVEEPSPVIETVKVEEPAPVAEPVKELEVIKDTVTITDTPAITITAKTDVVPSTISTLDAWPFTAPVEAPAPPVAKKTTATKKPKVVVDKKPVPAIKASNSKSRKKK